MKTKGRVLALLLALVLCFSTLATTAFAYAEDQDPEPETTTQETTAPEVEEELPPVETQPVVAETGSVFTDEGNLITRDLLFDKNTNKHCLQNNRKQHTVKLSHLLKGVLDVNNAGFALFSYGRKSDCPVGIIHISS